MTAVPLLDRVASAAEAEAARRLADGHARADLIRTSASAARDDRRRAATDALRAELATAHEQACAEASARTARAVLEARDRLLTRAFTEAESQLVRLPESPELLRCLEWLIGDALTYVDVGRQRLACNAESRSLVATVLRSLGCPDVPIAIDDNLSTGAVVRSDDGRVSIDATLVGQLRNLRQSMSIAALAVAAGARVP